ncbi:PP2C family protein-serine/threonine phosphatase [Streptomyces coelicoflavus]|uniref:PP2C family protein-serine/threonine phosphatase n=1 Tax=Streptomyces coelicoflavus TaxID=285562 RepID=UPI00364557D3
MDGFLTPQTVLAGLLVLGPLLAAIRLGTMRTAAVGAYAMVLCVLLGPVNDIWGTADHFLRLTILAIGSGLAVYAAHARTSRERALTTVARVAQEAILLPVSAQMGHIRVATRYRCAGKDALVGGDLFDIACTSQGVRVLIGDVRGKGLDATLTAARTLGSFRHAVYAEPDLAGVARYLDTVLAGQLGPEEFVTAAITEFTPGRVTVVNCGHHPPLLLGDAVHLITPEEPDLPLGLGTRPKPRTVKMRTGQRLLLYTDGLVEARDASDRMFDLQEQATPLRDLPSLDGALEDLLERLDAHTRPALTDDDIALVLCEATGSTPP